MVVQWDDQVLLDMFMISHVYDINMCCVLRRHYQFFFAPTHVKDIFVFDTCRALQRQRSFTRVSGFDERFLITTFLELKRVVSCGDRLTFVTSLSAYADISV